MRALRLTAAASRAPRPARRPRHNAVKAKKSFGQHFLTDEAVVAAIASQARIQAGDHVLEIGPGTGNLTAALLRAGARVTAIEADRTLLDGLGGRFEQELGRGQLRLVGGDATRVNLREHVGGGPARVVANLPYNITTVVLKLLLPMGDVLDDLFVMLQLEAAQRLTGSLPGNDQVRGMSVLVDFYSSASLGMRVGCEAFEPPPNVDSAMVRFRLKRPEARLAVPSEAAFQRLVAVAFSSRRKVLRNSLKAAYEPARVEAALAGAGLAPDARPQELAVEHFAALARALA